MAVLADALPFGAPPGRGIRSSDTCLGRSTRGIFLESLGHPRAIAGHSRRMTRMRPIQCLVETAVYADDLNQAERFYREVLGLELLSAEEGRHVFFRVGDQDVLLVFRSQATRRGDRLPGHGTDGAGHFAMGISSADLDAWRDWLLAHDVVIEHEESWPLGGKSLYFRDPAGNSVELITPGVWGLASGW
jgi:catechol 2,3-dioxygenase-like lactoylglutathione lyase family enzyme